MRKKRRPTPLSEQEKKVAALTGIGFSNQQIADELGLTKKAVKETLVKIMHKLGVENKLQVAAFVGSRMRPLGRPGKDPLALQ